MSTPNDGGPAFPNVPSDPGYSQWDTGMTLRDYFAAKALQGFCANGNIRDSNMVMRSYQLADAMIAARKPRADAQKGQP